MAVSSAIVSVMGPLQLSLSSGKVSMVRVSVLNDALKSMYNAEKRGEKAGHDQAIIQGDHQVLDSHAASWLVLKSYAPFQLLRSGDMSLISVTLCRLHW